MSDHSRTYAATVGDLQDILGPVPAYLRDRNRARNSTAFAIDPNEDFKAVAKKALEHVDPILPRLFHSGEWLPDGEFGLLNPHRADDTIWSFRINPTTGAWSDFALTKDANARGGDIISLVAYFY
jgi:hypothetical protein